VRTAGGLRPALAVRKTDSSQNSEIQKRNIKMDTEIILQGFINEARSELKRFQVVALVIAMDIEREDAVYTVMVTGNGPSVEELNEALRSGYRLEGFIGVGPTWADDRPTGYYIRPFRAGPGTYKHLLALLRQKIEQHEQLQVNEDL
jgi:hypothetical protein